MDGAPGSGLLCEDMGLGKTLEILSLVHVRPFCPPVLAVPASAEAAAAAAAAAAASVAAVNAATLQQSPRLMYFESEVNIREEQQMMSNISSGTNAVMPLVNGPNPLLLRFVGGALEAHWNAMTELRPYAAAPEGVGSLKQQAPRTGITALELLGREPTAEDAAEAERVRSAIRDIWPTVHQHPVYPPVSMGSGSNGNGGAAAGMGARGGRSRGAGLSFPTGVPLIGMFTGFDCVSLKIAPELEQNYSSASAAGGKVSTTTLPYLDFSPSFSPSTLSSSSSSSSISASANARRGQNSPLPGGWRHARRRRRRAAPHLWHHSSAPGEGDGGGDGGGGGDDASASKGWIGLELAKLINSPPAGTERDVLEMGMGDGGGGGQQWLAAQQLFRAGLPPTLIPAPAQGVLGNSAGSEDSYSSSSGSGSVAYGASGGSAGRAGRAEEASLPFHQRRGGLGQAAWLPLFFVSTSGHNGVARAVMAGRQRALPRRSARSRVASGGRKRRRGPSPEPE